MQKCNLNQIVLKHFGSILSSPSIFDPLQFVFFYPVLTIYLLLYLTLLYKQKEHAPWGCESQMLKAGSSKQHKSFLLYF